jgi:hypothetical protein
MSKSIQNGMNPLFKKSLPKTSIGIQSHHLWANDRYLAGRAAQADNVIIQFKTFNASNLDGFRNLKTFPRSIAKAFMEPIEIKTVLFC